MNKHILYAAMLSLASAAPAAATQIYDPTVSSCTGADCSSVSFGATVNSVAGLSAGPWTISVFAASNECLRLFVPAQNTDLETVAVAPNGSVFRNDDGGGLNRPLVKINGTQRGWYTVSISHWAGSAVESDFILNYGRYPLNNPNCAGPTPPAAAAAEASKSGGAGPAARSGPTRR